MNPVLAFQSLQMAQAAAVVGATSTLRANQTPVAAAAAADESSYRAEVVPFPEDAARTLTQPVVPTVPVVPAQDRFTEIFLDRTLPTPPERLVEPSWVRFERGVVEREDLAKTQGRLVTREAEHRLREPRGVQRQIKTLLSQRRFESLRQVSVLDLKELYEIYGLVEEFEEQERIIAMVFDLLKIRHFETLALLVFFAKKNFSQMLSVMKMQDADSIRRMDFYALRHLAKTSEEVVDLLTRPALLGNKSALMALREAAGENPKAAFILLKGKKYGVYGFAGEFEHINPEGLARKVKNKTRDAQEALRALVALAEEQLPFAIQDLREHFIVA